MANRDQFFTASHYLFIFAHPDDEIYTCAFITRLVKEGKEVHLLYVTSGDYQGAEFGPLREREVLESAEITGVPTKNVHFLRVQERKLMDSLPAVLDQLTHSVNTIRPDRIISHNFEGGHNGHDAVSFCASRVAFASSVPFYVFPAYRGWPEQRVWNQFPSDAEATDTLTLTPDLQELQNKVITVHKTQADFFSLIRQSASNETFSKREVLRHIDKLTDYTETPDHPVGYEYPGSKIKFSEFQSLIKSISK